MAVVFGPNGYYVGLSSDTKPATAAPGSLFYATDTGVWSLMNSAASWVAFTGAGQGGAAGARSQFIANVLALFSAHDVRAFILPSAADTTTSPDLSSYGRTATWNQTPVLTAQGLGYLVTLDGDNDFFSIADAADLSFGDGSNDEALSMIWFGQFTDTSAIRMLMAKDNAAGTAREYSLRIDAADKLAMFLHDQSASASESKVSNSAVSQGALHIYAGVYSAANGGTSADSDITLYEDATSLAATGGADGTYVAMEDLETPFTMGIQSGAVNDVAGFFGYCLLVQGAVSAAQLHALNQYTNAFFATSL